MPPNFAQLCNFFYSTTYTRKHIYSNFKKIKNILTPLLGTQASDISVTQD